MILKAPTLEDCQQVRLWRNECLETLRTPYPLTEEMQEAFYRDVICNRNSPHRYWSIFFSKSEILKIPMTNIKPDTLVGFGGMTNIEWENRQAEISLIIEPEIQGQGYGNGAVHLLLDQAFNFLDLELVYGECYCCNLTGQKFWEKVVKRYGGECKYIRKGKFWNGKRYVTLYFDIEKYEFRKQEKTV